MSRGQPLLLLSIVVFVAGCSDPQPSKKPVLSIDNNPTVLEAAAYVKGSVSYIVQCETSCDAVATQIERSGGTVLRRFENIAAITVKIPAGTASTLSDIPGVKGASKNSKIAIPPRRQRYSSEKMAQAGKAVRQVALKPRKSINAGNAPLDFGYNNTLLNAAAVQADGHVGKDVVVAVIDTGVANNPDVVPTLAGSVIGGETFVTNAPADEPSATSTLNDGHGTLVSTQIAAHAQFEFPADHELVLSLLEHMPGSLTKQDDGSYLVPIMGVAPGAKIYALKVFSAIDTHGASDSDVLAAMDRALTLKRNFNAGKSATPVSGTGSEDDPYVYNALNIQVVNLSLGGPSLHPGFEAEDLLTLEMLKAGITVVLAAGNEGPGAMTVGSPASSFGGISVAAANDAAHERVAIDMEFGLGEGVLWRPTPGVQTAVFSSRGPLADGRVGIHLTAPGVGTLGQSANGDLDLVDGTSLSAPQVAGAAALLQGAFPAARAAQIRDALITKANPKRLVDKSAPIDQGNGFLDVGAAYAGLKAGVTGTIPSPPKTVRRVSENIKRAEVEPIKFNRDKFTTTVELAPGQVAQFLIDNSTRDIYTIDVRNVTPELPRDQQNPIWGDDLGLSILDGEWSFPNVQFSKILPNTAVYNDYTRFQNGLPRIVLMGDWTNAGKITVTLTVKVERVVTTTLPGAVTGEIRDQASKFFNLEVPKDNKLAFFNLSWPNDWRFYPTHDIDLLLATPEGDLNLSGATFASPERFMLARMPPGNYALMVDGYAVHGMEEDFTLSVTDEEDKALRITKRRPPPVIPPGSDSDSD